MGIWSRLKSMVKFKVNSKCILKTHNSKANTAQWLTRIKRQSPMVFMHLPVMSFLQEGPGTQWPLNGQ